MQDLLGTAKCPYPDWFADIMPCNSESRRLHRWGPGEKLHNGGTVLPPINGGLYVTFPRMVTLGIDEQTRAQPAWFS